MSAPQKADKTEIRKLVSSEEWQVRVDLAAAYRLVADFGWDDLVFTHIRTGAWSRPPFFDQSLRNDV